MPIQPNEVRDSAVPMRVQRALYSDALAPFLACSPEATLGAIVGATSFPITTEQGDAWAREIALLNEALRGLSSEGAIHFEYSIPRLGKHVDVVLVLRHVVFVIEFKVGESAFLPADIDQVWDYALDLRNFHETSHSVPLAPLLVATEARPTPLDVVCEPHDPTLPAPIRVGRGQLRAAIDRVLATLTGPPIDALVWERGRYRPTPTIVEAARALYAGHSVEEISRSDAGALNLIRTSKAIDHIIREARDKNRKAICFITGVPGSGKTLVGLDVATRHIEPSSELFSVFLSGNGPLVAVLREALVRDEVARQKQKGGKLSKKAALRQVKLFIQNVHNFRDDCLADEDRPPIEHVALFDEAQRAWNLAQTRKFMQNKKNRPGFEHSEPEFLISCLDRHPDWAVVVCLVGGGQEINTGEAGISEWIDALLRRYADWHVYLPPRLRQSEYRAEAALQRATELKALTYRDDLHLATSMRSFRAERLSEFVRLVLDLDPSAAQSVHAEFADRYPIYLTRDLEAAKAWVRSRARGSERYGLIVSSNAVRLKPYAIDVRPVVNPVHWFLHEKGDVRSSYYLEDVATEFQVQGLELDWACVVWDADLRHTAAGWRHHEFKGTRWNRVNQLERQRYLENAYRVLLTRARQGMVVVVPNGDPDDPTRAPALYNETFDYLRRAGLPTLA